MQTIIFNIDDKLDIKDNLSICLGYFDGLHIGHKKLINRAKSSQYKSALLTFIFEEEVNIKNKNFITSISDKEYLLNKMNVDYFLILKFDNKIKSLLPEEFIEKIIMKLNPKQLIVGEDYRFGKMAQGDVNYLKSYSDKYEVIIVEEERIDDVKIGTSLIINLLQKGDIKKVNNLLGYNYKITGIVEKGYKLGNKYHFPTANIKLNNYVKPKNGVYACLITIDDKIYQGMTNIGNHPTINRLNEPLLEVHIFDFNQDIYHKKISVELIDYIRDEVNFTSVDELYAQLKLDLIKCKNVFATK